MIPFSKTEVSLLKRPQWFEREIYCHSLVNLVKIVVVFHLSLAFLESHFMIHGPQGWMCLIIFVVKYLTRRGIWQSGILGT